MVEFVASRLQRLGRRESCNPGMKWPVRLRTSAARPFLAQAAAISGRSKSHIFVKSPASARPGKMVETATRRSSLAHAAVSWPPQPCVRFSLFYRLVNGLHPTYFDVDESNQALFCYFRSSDAAEMRFLSRQQTLKCQGRKKSFLHQRLHHSVRVGERATHACIDGRRRYFSMF